jgi:hypothetical protein
VARWTPAGAASAAARRSRSRARAARRYAFGCRPSSRGGSPSRKVRTSQGKVVGNADPGKPAGKCHRKDTAYVRRHGGPARVKWCGKSAPASRRRGGQANPTRCKAKQDRLQAARQGPGRPHRWMAAHDRIRLMCLLRRSPASAGLLYGPSRRGLVGVAVPAGALAAMLARIDPRRGPISEAGSRALHEQRRDAVSAP